jgi:hypothetical protein
MALYTSIGTLKNQIHCVTVSTVIQPTAIIGFFAAIGLSHWPKGL